MITTEPHDEEPPEPEPELCRACDGSGEGMHDGTRCQTCRGSGVEPTQEEIDEQEAALAAAEEYSQEHDEE